MFVHKHGDVMVLGVVGKGLEKVVALEGDN